MSAEKGKSKVGFDNDKYLQEQTRFILERAKHGGEKLYIECGGKLLHDFHASRVLPGYDPDVKMRVFSSLVDKIDIIICIHAEAIENKKIRADFGTTYDADVFKMIEDFKAWGLNPTRVVITRFKGEKSALLFKDLLERRGIKVYLHTPTKGYPTNVDEIVSDAGYGQNEYIETEKPIVIVTAPGPGSGKLGTCLSQIYHEFKRGKKASYSKFETFPIWNLPIDHPVNVAYEAATADLGDVNLIDHFYLASTGKTAVNYNRDLEAFPLLKRILEKITGDESIYKSPTDMGVNRCGFGIVNDALVREAANQEIIRRYLIAREEYAKGRVSKQTVDRSYDIMSRMGLTPLMRPVVPVCHARLASAIAKGKGKDGITCVGAIELPDGEIVTGTNSPLMHASTAMLFNALKTMAKIDDDVDLIPEDIIRSVRHMKKDILHEVGCSLNLDEGLICLALSAATSKDAKRVLETLPKVKGLPAHLSHIPSSGDLKGLRVLGINVTSEDVYPRSELARYIREEV